MNRRESLELLTCFSPLIISPTTLSTTGTLDNEEWLRHFQVRWNGSRTYYSEVHEAMPQADFSFTPHLDVKSFAGIMTHIGWSLQKYAGVLDGSDPGDELMSSDKKEVFAFVDKAFEHFNEALHALDMDKLFTISHAWNDVEPWKDFSTFDVITLAYNHTTHHIAQATVYLRLNDVEPPPYRF